MQNQINTTSTDLLAVLGAKMMSDKLMETPDGFKSLLGDAMQGSKVQKGKSDKVDDATASDAAAALATPQPEVVQEAAETGEAGAAAEAAAATGETALAAVAQMAAALDTLPQTETGDILSMELTATGDEVEVLAAETQLPANLIVEDAAGDDRFSQMLDQAQQQLQQTATAAEETPVTEETEAVETTPVEEALPAEEEAAADEAPADEPEIRQAQPETTARTTTARTDQKPLKEMPETDRTILEMERPGTEQQPIDTGIRERGVQPQLAETAPTQPEQPAYRTDQGEQIQVQVTENLQRGDMEFRMQLSPAELGDIEVKMVLEGGRLAIEILTASERTSALLQRQIDALTASLRVHANQEITSVQVVTETATASGHMDGAFNMDTQAEQGAFGGKQGGGKPGATGEGQDDDQQTAQEAQLEPERLLNYTI